MSAPDIPSAVWNVFPNERKARMRYERFRRVLLDMLENPLTVAGMIIVFSFFLLAILAPILEPATGNDPYQMPRNFEALRQPPLTDGYLLGTTETGGDLLYGIVWGSRLTIAISSPSSSRPPSSAAPSAASPATSAAGSTKSSCASSTR
ncbi:hypothetical protein ACFQH8_19435 [Halomicroarcula sp. GCM10025710]